MYDNTMFLCKVSFAYGKIKLIDRESACTVCHLQQSLLYVGLSFLGLLDFGLSSTIGCRVIRIIGPRSSINSLVIYFGPYRELYSKT